MIRTSLIIAALLAAGGASATTLHEAVARAMIQNQVAPLVAFKVGDTANYNMTISSMTGTMVMSITAVTPTAVTIDQKMNLGAMGSEDVQEVIDPTNGNVISITANGQKQTPPAPGDTQILSETPTSITVPAGTFKCLDVKTHAVSENVDSEQWMDNDGVVPVGGMLKMTTTEQGMPIEADLTSFSHGS